MNWHWDRLEHRPLRSLRAGTAHHGVPELVLVPGLGALGYLLPLVRACAAWTRVHLLDVPGFGHASTAACPASLADVTRDVTAWLDVVAGAPVLLMGHSTGAQAAVHAALARPKSVASLALASPTFPPDVRRWRPLAARVARTIPYESVGLIGATLPQYLRGRSGVLTLLRTAMDDAPDALLPAVACPVTVVRGMHDALCPEHWASALADRTPHGDRVTVPGAHNFPYNAPVPTARALRAAAGRATTS